LVVRQPLFSLPLFFAECLPEVDRAALDRMNKNSEPLELRTGNQYFMRNFSRRSLKESCAVRHVSVK
jgi:hypothetical protein